MAENSPQPTHTSDEQLARSLGLTDTATSQLDTVIDKLVDAETPGYWAEFTAEEAEMAGAFTENALSEDAAYESSFDNPIVLNSESEII